MDVGAVLVYVDNSDRVTFASNEMLEEMIDTERFIRFWSKLSLSPWGRSEIRRPTYVQSPHIHSSIYVRRLK